MCAACTQTHGLALVLPPALPAPTQPASCPALTLRLCFSSEELTGSAGSYVLVVCSSSGLSLAVSEPYRAPDCGGLALPPSWMWSRAPPHPELQAVAGAGSIKHNNVHSVEMLTAGRAGQLFQSAWPSGLAWPCLPCGVCPLLSADSSEEGGGLSPSRGGPSDSAL